MLNYRHVKKYAAEAGFSLCGMARARALTEERERFAAGLAVSGDAALDYLVRNPARRFDPSSLLPGALTVVVCALRYDPRPLDTPEGKVSAHRRIGDYHPIIKGMLMKVLERLSVEHPDVRGRALCDTAPILEKAWAVEAGLGWIGRNSLLVNPTFGSFLLLGELVLDVESDCYDEPYTGPGCGGCRRCVENCPTGALVVSEGGAGMVDTGRCISALTIEKGRRGEPIEALHGWVYGCDECQSVCPYKKTA